MCRKQQTMKREERALHAVNFECQINPSAIFVARITIGSHMKSRCWHRRDGRIVREHEPQNALHTLGADELPVAHQTEFWHLGAQV